MPKTAKKEDIKVIPKTSKEPTTMEELLALEENKVRGLRKGEIIEGIVSEITSKNIFIDIGAKTEGVVLGREFDRSKDFIRNLKPGDKVKAYVGSVESENGQILLSLRQAASDFAWEGYENLFKDTKSAEVKGRELNRGGLIVDTQFGLQGFVPGSQIGTVWQGKLDQLVGQKFEVKVIEVNREQNRLVFSEKLVSDAEKIEKTAEAMKKIKLEDSFEAEVTQVAPFGLFVKVNVEGESIEGLIHISEVSWQKVEDLDKLYKPRNKIKVKVISLEDGRVQFSIKQLLPDPWEELDKKYQVDTKIKGKIARLTSFGVLVEIESGIEGLVHISKIPPELTLNEGDELDVYIESVDRKTRRISLGLVLSQKPIGYK
ncbi:S1 RNA-binding domain-containing protein [Patescibacteria group bacterium]|nr:S1 RNA-binding domain-containing protein [Patescibacteria group bacterium]